MFIIDPPQGRPHADELIMVQNAFDPNFNDDNEVYAVNTVAFHFMYRPVRVKQLVPRARKLLPPVSDRDVALADRIHRHGHPGAGPAGRARAALPSHREVHVQRAQEQVRSARPDGILRSRGVRIWLLGVPIGLLGAAAVIAYLARGTRLHLKLVR
jgi:hypothetical protein